MLNQRGFGVVCGCVLHALLPYRQLENRSVQVLPSCVGTVDLLSCQQGNLSAVVYCHACTDITGSVGRHCACNTLLGLVMI